VVTGFTSIVRFPFELISTLFPVVTPRFLFFGVRSPPASRQITLAEWPGLVSASAMGTLPVPRRKRPVTTDPVIMAIAPDIVNLHPKVVTSRSQSPDYLSTVVAVHPD